VKIVELAEATEPLSEYARRLRREAVVVTRNGKPMATLSTVPEGSDWESLAVANHPRFQAIMDRSRASHREHGGISPAEMRRHFKVKPRTKKAR
jgi:hypothetical protein